MEQINSMLRALATTRVINSRTLSWYQQTRNWSFLEASPVPRMKMRKKLVLQMKKLDRRKQ